MGTDFANSARARADRAEKVATLVTILERMAVKKGLDPRSPEFIEALAAKDSAWWRLIAKRAGVNDPGPQSIAQVVAHFREQPELDAAVARLTENNPNPGGE